MHEFSSVLVKLTHACLKRSQAVEIGERSHGAPKQILKVKTNEQGNDWYKNVQLATITHKKNLSFCKKMYFPTVLFHGGESKSPLDDGFSNKIIEKILTE